MGREVWGMGHGYLAWRVGHGVRAVECGHGEHGSASPNPSPFKSLPGFRALASFINQNSYPRSQERSSRVCMCDISVPSVLWQSPPISTCQRVATTRS
jgi:hypothetical protein